MEYPEDRPVYAMSIKEYHKYRSQLDPKSLTIIDCNPNA